MSMQLFRPLRFIVLCSLIAAFPWLHAQNLFPNPSFELQTGCPTAPGNFTIVGSWYVVVNHTGSPDYFHVCGNSTFGVPTNVFGSQLARTGSAYIGFVTHFGSGNFREYLQAPVTGLTPGQTYTASAYLTLSDGSGWATDGFGFYFSNTAVTGSGASTPLPYTPQVARATNSYINDKTNWMLTTGNFVATAGMAFVTLGNFKADATTNVQVQASGWSWNYTYLDDVSLTLAIVLSADITDFGGMVADDHAHISWQTSAERGTQSYELERSVGDLNHFERIARIPATGGEFIQDYAYDDPGFVPTQLNYYRLKEVDQNGEGGYTETIELHTDALVNEVSITAYPNPVPASEQASLQIVTSKAQRLTLQLVDVNGRLVSRETVDVEVGEQIHVLPTAGLASGCYVASATGDGVQVHTRVLVR